MKHVIFDVEAWNGVWFEELNNSTCFLYFGFHMYTICCEVLINFVFNYQDIRMFNAVKPENNN
jgi:hypothetical protein